MSHTQHHREHRHLIHREDLDQINEHYVEHHIRKAESSLGWLVCIIFWGVLAYLGYEYLQDLFFDRGYWIGGWLGLSIISRLMVGIDFGVRV